MLVGNVYYVTHSYNQSRFRLLLESQLSKKRGSALSPELIEQCLAAYLECKDSKSLCVNIMSHLLSDMDIQFSDYRSYDDSKTDGNPEDAVRIFNELANDFIKYKQIQINQQIELER